MLRRRPSALAFYAFDLAPDKLPARGVGDAGEEGSRQRDPLLLTGRKAQPGSAELRVVALTQSDDAVVGACGPRCCNNQFGGGCRIEARV